MPIEEEQLTSNHKDLDIAIVGAGDIGSDLFKIFNKMPSTKIKYVVDKNKEAPGMKLAHENDVKTTTDLMEALADQTLDLILEVTGVSQVLATIKENKAEGTEVVSGEASYLVYDIIKEYKKYQQQLLDTVINHLKEIHMEIEDDSQSIDDFLAEIEKVTKNLNMLSVNASIEAAKAGAEGGGFSVVADEVKDLSEESSKLVQNIEEINKNILNLNNRITEVVGELKEQG